MSDVIETGELRAELNPAHHGAQLQADAPRKEYVVTNQTVRDDTDESTGSDGIFYDSKLYKPGERIELDAHTAAQFLALGDIEEVPGA